MKLRISRHRYGVLGSGTAMGRGSGENLQEMVSLVLAIAKGLLN